MGKRARRRRREERACLSKVPYPSEMAAMDAAVRTGLVWYRCPYCHRWHLTHDVRRKPKHRR